MRLAASEGSRQARGAVPSIHSARHQALGTVRQTGRRSRQSRRCTPVMGSAPLPPDRTRPGPGGARGPARAQPRARPSRAAPPPARAARPPAATGARPRRCPPPHQVGRQGLQLPARAGPLHSCTQTLRLCAVCCIGDAALQQCECEKTRASSYRASAGLGYLRFQLPRRAEQQLRRRHKHARERGQRHAQPQQRRPQRQQPRLQGQRQHARRRAQDLEGGNS